MTYRFPAVLCSRFSFRLSVRQGVSRVILRGSPLRYTTQCPIWAHPFDFYSTDYFALLPWLFLFWAGYYLHKAVGRRRMEPLRRSVCPALGWMGRHSLLLYLLHQPVIYGVLSAAAVLFA